MLIQLGKIFTMVAAMIAGAGCGSISKVQPSTLGQSTDLKTYQRVIVQPFEDLVSAKAKDPEVQAERKAGVGKFRELLAMEFRASGTFKEVLTEGAAEPNTFLIGGKVTRYVQGSKAARLLVGLGAGNAYFDATVEIRDAASKELLGTVLVDRNSWGGGGWMSMSQTLDSFMTEAARVTAARIVAARNQGTFTPSPKK